MRRTMNKHSVNIVMIALSWILVAGVSAESLADTQDQQYTDAAEDDGGRKAGNRHSRRLFERETFGGNGRTCRTCHGHKTGTISPAEAQRRFYVNPEDPLLVHDGSDDGHGNGVTRMLEHATILVEIPLP